jgi:hypothetical protein
MRPAADVDEELPLRRRIQVELGPEAERVLVHVAEERRVPW